MTLTNKQLEAEVKRILELDQKRTQGKWDFYCRDCGIDKEDLDKYPNGGCGGFLGWELEGVPDAERGQFQNGYDAAFVASAPQMAQIIRQIWEERQNSIPIAKLDEMVEKVAKAISDVDIECGWDGIDELKASEAAINAIKQEK